MRDAGGMEMKAPIGNEYMRLKVAAFGAGALPRSSAKHCSGGRVALIIDLAPRLSRRRRRGLFILPDTKRPRARARPKLHPMIHASPSCRSSHLLQRSCKLDGLFILPEIKTFARARQAGTPS